MSKKRIEKPYAIQPVSELPPTKRKLRETIYDDVIKDLMGKEKGIYKITIEGKTLKTIYPALNKRIIERKLPMKLRVRSGELYIEKTE
jgi:hypothetical protein